MVIGLCKCDLTFFKEKKDDITLLDVRLKGQHWQFQYQFRGNSKYFKVLCQLLTKNFLNKKMHCNTVSAMKIL